MILKTLIGIFLCVFVCASSVAKTLPFVAKFEPNGVEYEDPNMNTGVNGESEYLNYHNILPVLQDNPYLYNPNFEVGVADYGIYANHVDFHKFYEDFLTGDNPKQPSPNHSHGTMVASVFALSQVSNEKGIHGIVNAKVNFATGEGYEDNLNQALIDFLDALNSKVINMSYGLDYCNTYQAYRNAQNGILDLDLCPDLNQQSVYSQQVTLLHVQEMQDIREIMKAYPERLFVLAAGNSGMDAIVENGAIHYKIGSNGQPELDKLSNVIVVANVANTDILVQDSNYGVSLDIAVMGHVFAAHAITQGTDIYGTADQTSFSAPITSGMDTLLFSANPNLTPAQAKNLLTNHNKGLVSERYNGSSIPFLTKDNLNHSIPIADLSSSYAVLKNNLYIETVQDVNILDGIYRTAQNDEDCVNVWKSTISSRTVDGVNPDYEARFYGDRCLYFRGNSYIIDYDLTTYQATHYYFSDYGQNKYREYMTFRHFVNNLKSAKNDSIWRNGYGVTLNSSGNVGCTVADNCVDENITTAQQCIRMFQALSGDYPNFVGYNKVVLKSQNICTYSTDTVVVEYDAENNEVKVKINPMNQQDLIVFLNSKVQEYHQLWLLHNKPSIYYMNSQGDYVEFSNKGYPKKFYMENMEIPFFNKYVNWCYYEGKMPGGIEEYYVLPVFDLLQYNTLNGFISIL